MDIFKKTFAKAASDAFRQEYADIFAQTGDEQVFSEQFVADNLEKPKDPSMGRFAFPVFRYGKLLQAKPPEIASQVCNRINQLLSESTEPVIECEAVHAFINIRTNFGYEAKSVIGNVLTDTSSYGSSDIGTDKKMLVEYSAPNIAKPFGIGHLRTTILGNSLRRIYQKLGYDVVGINYLGDWGTQFGKMLCAYKKWHDPSKNGQETVNELLALYIKFHEEAEKNPDLEIEARAEFKKLEEKDPENIALWERFRQVSLDEFNRVYTKMGIEFDWVTGEAFLEDKMEPVIERLEKAGLTSVSDGALIVDLHDEQLPPVLLRKADGATLYATRDIAGFLYRQKEYDFNGMLYVVATNQSVHFQQVFKTIGMLEEAENIPEEKQYSDRATHVDFGLIKFGDQMLSTRKGNIIFLEDVIDTAADLAKEKIKEKNPELIDIDETSLMIGLGAVMFSQLSVRRQKEVNFNWEEVLSFEGETGPYLQYTHARLCSLLRHYGKEIETGTLDYMLLDNEEEKRVIELLADFPQAVADAGRLYEPNMISTHLLKLASAFNKVYQRKDSDGRIDKIISDNEALSAVRIGLVKSVQTVIKEGLYLLGIRAPEEM